MLVFVVAIQPIMLVSGVALEYILSGNISEGLPFAAIALMCLTYFLKGAVEAFGYLKSKIKLDS